MERWAWVPEKGAGSVLTQFQVPARVIVPRRRLIAMMGTLGFTAGAGVAGRAAVDAFSFFGQSRRSVEKGGPIQAHGHVFVLARPHFGRGDVEGPQQARFVELSDPEHSGVAPQPLRVAVSETRSPGANAHAGVAAASLGKGAVVAANHGLVEARETTVDPADALDVYRSSIGV